MSSFTQGNASKTVASVCLFNASDVGLACGDSAKGIAKIYPSVADNLHEVDGAATTADVYIDVAMNQVHGRDEAGLVIPVIADIFEFGTGENAAIYRILLEETGDNTATFEGSIEYTMLSQINRDNTATYTTLATVDQDVDIIIEQDMTDEDSPRVNYLDLGADGVSTQIADQAEAPTHSGVVSFDLDNYKIADTVVVTLDDQDMNSDSELIDVYTTQATGDVVGEGTTLATGLVLDITFDDEGWQDDAEAGCNEGDITAAMGDDGLHATGFTLVETSIASGIFTGSFQVPTKYCSQATDSVVTVTGTDIEVNYQDFRNASGESIEVGDGASSYP
jgi:hypothetical protein